MFVKKVIIANIIAFIKTKILGPVLSVTNTPFKNDSPYGTVHNVYFVKYDVTVSFLAQVLDTGTYFFFIVYSQDFGVLCPKSCI